MSITLFVSDEEKNELNTASSLSSSPKSRAHEGMRQLSNLSGGDGQDAGKYERVDRILYEFEGYSLVYAVFQKRVDDEQEAEKLQQITVC